MTGTGMRCWQSDSMSNWDPGTVACFSQLNFPLEQRKQIRRLARAETPICLIDLGRGRTQCQTMQKQQDFKKQALSKPSDFNKRAPIRNPGESGEPYLSERQWGTVREDYSRDGNAWSYSDRTDSGAKVRVGIG